MTKHRTAIVLAIGALGLLGCPAKQQTVKIAVILPLSGPAGAYGESIRAGVELAEEAQPQVLTADGTVLVELMVRDSGGEPERAADLLEEAFASGAAAAIGGALSSEALQMVGIADEAERVLISPSASSPELSGMSEFFSRVFPSDFVEGTRMGGHAWDELQLSSVAILAVETTYGRGIHGIFQDEFTKRGGKVVEVIEYPPSTSDFEGLVERVATIDPPGVYVAAYWDQVADLVRGLREAGYEGTILTTAAFATTDAFERAGEYANGVYFTQTVFDTMSDAEPIRGFVASYRLAHDEDPDLYAAHGYDAMLVIQEAIRKGGASPSEIKRGLLSIRSLAGVTGSIQFDERGDVQKYPRVYQVQNGVPVPYEKVKESKLDAIRRKQEEIERKRRQLLQGS